MKKKQTKPEKHINVAEATAIKHELADELSVNPKYSLEVDPEDKYGLPESTKNFVKQYIQFKNVNTAAEICGIEQDVANQLFASYPVQSEIRRINLALYQRRFVTKMLDLDKLGGFLTTLLTDEYVPLADQLNSSDKLRVIDMLIRLNQIQSDSFEDPDVIMSKDIETQLKNLSVATIKKMLTENNSLKKTTIIESDDAGSKLTPEEKAYLETLPSKELLSIIKKMDK